MLNITSTKNKMFKKETSRHKKPLFALNFNVKLKYFKVKFANRIMEFQIFTL
jgi:hypothetical protein